MIDIENIKDEIIEKLKPLNPDKVILFGSYAYGIPTKDSDIDLFLVKDDKKEKHYEAKAMMQLRSITQKYHIGFDILSTSSEALHCSNDHFYKVDILSRGKVLYGE
ncbi:MAG: nucleotidyltransferase domain-containing protein [Campylobacterota bacterium]|nr:nucleotidyltransferase domain-containing protein [Campylobacterota bacterium]